MDVEAAESTPSSSSFDLAEQLLRLQEDDLDLEYDVASFDSDAQQSHITRVVDAVALSVTSVQDTNIYQYILCSIKCIGSMRSDLSHRLLDTLLSGMNVILDEIADMEPTAVASYTEPLERYAFLVKWMTEMMEKHRDQHGSSDKGLKRAAASTRKRRILDVDLFPPICSYPHVQDVAHCIRTYVVVKGDARYFCVSLYPAACYAVPGK